MPTATTFDPLKAARDLEAAAVADRDQLATKADLAALRNENRLLLGFLSALVLAMAARMFGLA